MWARRNRIHNIPFFMQIYSLEVINYRQVRPARPTTELKGVPSDFRII